jgi:hypothetical protein
MMSKGASYMEGVRAEAPKLAFDDLVNQLYAGQDPPGVEEALESEHRSWCTSFRFSRTILRARVNVRSFLL